MLARTLSASGAVAVGDTAAAVGIGVTADEVADGVVDEMDACEDGACASKSPKSSSSIAAVDVAGAAAGEGAVDEVDGAVDGVVDGADDGGAGA